MPVSSLKRMALSGEAFGNRMCYLEDISNEVEYFYSIKKSSYVGFFFNVRFVVLI